MRHGWGRMSEAEAALGALLGLMARLRDPERGCPWDREQTFGSIAPYTIEEAYEVADAIERADPRQLRARVQEELAELDRALAALAGRGFDARARESVADELGDLLFSIVNWSRHLELDAEAALRAASAKFERRFAAMEALARARGLDLKQLSAAEWDALWSEAKLNGA